MGGVDAPARLLRETDWRRVRDTDADTVELKALLAPGSDAVGAVGDHVRRTRRRRLYLVDTAGARLARAGLVVRLRRLGPGRADLAVRTREPSHRGVRRPGVRVELDVLPGAFWRTEQLGRPVDTAEAAAFRAGELPVGALLSDAQRDFLARVGRTLPEPPDWDALRAHGPLGVERMRLDGRGWGDARAFLERCTLPDGTCVEELSVRCAPANALRAAAASCVFLERCRLRLAERHRSKTQLLVECFTPG